MLCVCVCVCVSWTCETHCTRSEQEHNDPLCDVVIKLSASTELGNFLVIKNETHFHKKNSLSRT